MIFRRRDHQELPADLQVSLFGNAIMWRLEKFSWGLFTKLMDFMVASHNKKSWGEDKNDWGYGGSSFARGYQGIVCNDELIPLTKEGKITSTANIRRFVGPKAVELEDGRILEDVDAVIACIGYTDDVPMLSEALSFVDPPRGTTAPIPNLYSA